MAELTWSPDGEQTFAKLLGAIPEAMRDMVRPKLLELLAARSAGAPVTPDTITEMVREDLPEPQKSMLLQALGGEPQGDTQAASSANQDAAAALEWTGKSKAMFEVMLGEVPEAMREVFRGKLTDVISQKSGGGSVTEDHVTAVVHEIVPEPFKSNILTKFKEVGDFDMAALDALIQHHGTSRDALMYILHDLQEQAGYLPVEALQSISNKCAIALSTIYNVVTFYKAFRLTPPGKHHIKVCRGTACHLHDTDGLAEDIENKAAGSSDVTMEKTLCLGCCDCAPAVEIDGRIYQGDEAKTKLSSL